MSSEMKNKIIQRHFCSMFGILMIEHGQCLIFTVKYKLQPVPRAGVFPADVETCAYPNQQQPPQGCRDRPEFQENFHIDNKPVISLLELIIPVQ